MQPLRFAEHLEGHNEADTRNDVVVPHDVAHGNMTVAEGMITLIASMLNGRPYKNDHHKNPKLKKKYQGTGAPNKGRRVEGQPH